MMSKFAVLLALLGNVCGTVLHHDEPNSELFRIVYDQTTNRIIVAGSNAVFMFDGLLQRLQTVEIGPIIDSSICEDQSCHERLDNRPRVLLPSPDGRSLIYFAGPSGDRCYVYDSQNLNIFRELRAKDTSFIGLGDSVAVAFAGDWSLFVARSFDGVNPYALASFNLKEELLSSEMDYHGGVDVESGIMFSESLKSSFIVSYVDAFEHEGFVYFLSVQRETEAEEAYHTKLVRVCANDRQFDSYSELELSCTRREFLTQSHVSFNIARTSHLAKVGLDLARRHDFDPNESVLYVVMGRGKPQALESEETVVCMYPMRSVQREFVKLQRDCYSGMGMILPWIDDGRRRCKMDVRTY